VAAPEVVAPPPVSKFAARRAAHYDEFRRLEDYRRRSEHATATLCISLDVLI